MYLHKIALLNYRNIVSSELEFNPKINCFLGRNGVGKTNMLDAVYYLSFCKSHLNPIDSQVINNQAEFFMIQGYYKQGDDSQEMISCSVRKRRKKVFQRNKKDYDKLSDHIGSIPIVLISPSDISLILGGSEERRKFMDTFISQYDKPYLASLIRYAEALKSRNALLKQDQMPDALMLDLYEEQMAMESAYIYSRRTAFIEGFMPVFQKYYDLISDGREQVNLTYTSHCNQGDLVPLLKECRMRDHALGYSTRGAHKDDLIMDLGAYPLKRNGSQGQTKSYLVALKLAQYIFLKDIKHVKPLLLLDDLFDKLDSERVTRIMELVSTDVFGQIFITDTNREHLDSILENIECTSQIFDIENLIDS